MLASSWGGQEGKGEEEGEKEGREGRHASHALVCATLAAACRPLVVEFAKPGGYAAHLHEPHAALTHAALQEGPCSPRPASCSVLDLASAVNAKGSSWAALSPR